MAIVGPAPIEELTVSESSRTGTVKVGGKPYKIANNSDTGFEGMVDLLASAFTNGKNVTLDVGPGDELDKVILKP